MKGDYTTNSYYITHTIAFWKVGRIHLLSSGVKGLNGWGCIRYLISNFFLIWNKSIVFYWLPNLTDDHPLRSPTKDHSGSTTSHWVVLFHHFYSTNQQTFYDHSNTTIDVWEGWVRHNNRLVNTLGEPYERQQVPYATAMQVRYSESKLLRWSLTQKESRVKC